MRRSWGRYYVLWHGKTFKVKLLCFHSACSLQRHFKRSELWLFLSGYGYFTKGYKSALDCIEVSKGDHVNVAIKEWHQFDPYVKSWVLEIQMGECAEEDIERK